MSLLNVLNGAERHLVLAVIRHEAPSPQLPRTIIALVVGSGTESFGAGVYRRRLPGVIPTQVVVPSVS
jgi:hypothetical protein